MSHPKQFLLLFVFVALFTVCLGCSGKPSDPPPSADGDDAVQTDDSAAPTDDAADESETDTTADAAPVVDADGADDSTEPNENPLNELEELVSRLAREAQDGAGYRVDDEVADELESLPGDVVEKLIPLLQSNNIDVARGAAVYLLIVFDFNNAELVEGLLSLMHRNDSTLSHLGLRSVRLLPPLKVEQAGPHLAELLADEAATEINRSEAARLFANMGDAASEWVPDLERAAAEAASTRVRSASLYAIGRVAEPQRATEAYIQALQNDASATVRAAAALRLSQLQRTPAVGPAVAAALEDEDSKVVENAILSLSRMGADGAAAAAEKLSSPDSDIQLRALQALIQVGQFAGAHLKAIEPLKDSDDQRISDAAGLLLARFATQADEGDASEGE